MIKRKRLISILICCILGFYLFLQTGCGKNKEISEIRFWHSYTGQQEAVFNMMVETYNSTEGKTRGIRIVPVYKTVGEIETYFFNFF